ncbi:hypothetical protein H6P81_003915 [Aristolochia fimbriata]|uniref:Uncharacterized protein n=1 Tax=Aristolochia fimbriata TaxID=158543 RepID=A0AAV7FHI7_ARIFI|nr:hypothetical protein H6P81_003915 [Aristolochia fimbriata]
MASELRFTEEDMEIDQGLGYPKAFAKLCRQPQLRNPYKHGPPFSYIPYSMQPQDSLMASDMNEIFPIIDHNKEPSMNPRHYVNLLWKQLNHLGNAGFDPTKFRVDPYGNVLYFHADMGSPLAWDIDHWFPCSRGGRTVPSNLRILQWQVSQRKGDKLEFLVPWWDLQLGISVNQFISIFASTNSDFRNRAFSWLFLDGENEELSGSQVVESHTFPQHFIEMEQKLGPASAAIVYTRGDMDSIALRSIDLNRNARPNSSSFGLKRLATEEDDTSCKAIQRFRPSMSKENEKSEKCSDQYLAIALARDSLRERNEKEKKLLEIENLENELGELKQRNEEERLTLQELELTLIKRKRRSEKCRRLAEAQSSYKASLEKMIRDAMHQSVVYKEQIRLTQAANNTLAARLEAQKAICDSSKRELQKRLKQRDEIESQLRPFYNDQVRKRSRIDNGPFDERYDENLHLLPLQKELRLFLEDEQKASGVGEKKQDEEERMKFFDAKDKEQLEEIQLDEELQKLTLGAGNLRTKQRQKKSKSVPHSPKKHEDEDYTRKIGKGNVEKWLKMLLDNTQEGSLSDLPSPNHDDEKVSMTEEIAQKLNLRDQQEDLETSRLDATAENNKAKTEVVKSTINMVSKYAEETDIGLASSVWKKTCEDRERGGEKTGKSKGIVRSESTRTFRSIPSSPSVILGMKKGVDCIGKKPLVIDDEDEDGDISHLVMTNKSAKASIRSYTKAFKKAVKI